MGLRQGGTGMIDSVTVLRWFEEAVQATGAAQQAGDARGVFVQSEAAMFYAVMCAVMSSPVQRHSIVEKYILDHTRELRDVLLKALRESDWRLDQILREVMAKLPHFPGLGEMLGRSAVPPALPKSDGA